MNDLVPVDPFALAERISRSNLIPQAYRGKPADAAVCIMYGAEVGLPPMTALQRIIVINGRPTLDAQGMAALIRGAGHSLIGEVTATEAKVTGKRADNGDTMTFTFSLDDAKRANLVKKGPWTDYPKAMLWARAVSQLARQLFPDVLMGMSYVPEEIGGEVEVPDEGPAGAVISQTGNTGNALDGTVLTQVGPFIQTPAPDEDDDAVDAELVDEPTNEPAPLVDTDTGEIIPDPPAEPTPLAIASTPQELKVQLNDLIRDLPTGPSNDLRAHLLNKFGPAPNRTLEQLQESVNVAAGWAL